MITNSIKKCEEKPRKTKAAISEITNLESDVIIQNPKGHDKIIKTSKADHSSGNKVDAIDIGDKYSPHTRTRHTEKKREHSRSSKKEGNSDKSKHHNRRESKCVEDEAALSKTESPKILPCPVIIETTTGVDLKLDENEIDNASKCEKPTEIVDKKRKRKDSSVLNEQERKDKSKSKRKQTLLPKEQLYERQEETLSGGEVSQKSKVEFHKHIETKKEELNSLSLKEENYKKREEIVSFKKSHKYPKEASQKSNQKGHHKEIHSASLKEQEATVVNTRLSRSSGSCKEYLEISQKMDIDEEQKEAIITRSSSRQYHNETNQQAIEITHKTNLHEDEKKHALPKQDKTEIFDESLEDSMTESGKNTSKLSRI
ncbi:hypothetical protein HHI36_020223 [Cryptolaemus montrouzieri]|uniref:Uncharacterized protein n=1 Tax=Cryptolaemus montrouzieri TaxID=559131 RepID=A0ABD2N9U1_9CUCU